MEAGTNGSRHQRKQAPMEAGPNGSAPTPNALTSLHHHKQAVRAPQSFLRIGTARHREIKTCLPNSSAQIAISQHGPTRPTSQHGLHVCPNRHFIRAIRAAPITHAAITILALRPPSSQISSHHAHLMRPPSRWLMKLSQRVDHVDDRGGDVFGGPLAVTK